MPYSPRERRSCRKLMRALHCSRFDRFGLASATFAQNHPTRPITVPEAGVGFGAKPEGAELLHELLLAHQSNHSRHPVAPQIRHVNAVMFGRSPFEQETSKTRDSRAPSPPRLVHHEISVALS